MSEVTLVDVVKDTFGESVGYLVVAGAFDGIFQDPTYGFENIGWETLCIEPNPEAFNRLAKNRSKAMCLQYALGTETDDGVPFEVFSAGGGASFSSFKASDALRKTFNYFGPYEKIIQVNVRTLDCCIREAGFPRVDMLTVDVEGWELEVLKGFSFDLWTPKLLNIENICQPSDLREYIKSFGYRMVGRAGYDDIFTK